MLRVEEIADDAGRLVVSIYFDMYCNRSSPIWFMLLGTLLRIHIHSKSHMSRCISGRERQPSTSRFPPTPFVTCHSTRPKTR